MHKFTVIWLRWVGKSYELNKSYVTLDCPSRDAIITQAWVDRTGEYPTEDAVRTVMCFILSGHAEEPPAWSRIPTLAPGDKIALAEPRDIDPDRPIGTDVYGPYDDGEETIEDIVAGAEASGFAGLSAKPLVSEERMELMRVQDRLILLRQQIDNAGRMAGMRDTVGFNLTNSVVEVLEALLAAVQQAAIGRDR